MTQIFGVSFIFLMIGWLFFNYLWVWLPQLHFRTLPPAERLTLTTTTKCQSDFIDLTTDHLWWCFIRLWPQNFDIWIGIIWLVTKQLIQNVSCCQMLSLPQVQWWMSSASSGQKCMCTHAVTVEPSSKTNLQIEKMWSQVGWPLVRGSHVWE